MSEHTVATVSGPSADITGEDAFARLARAKREELRKGILDSYFGFLEGRSILRSRATPTQQFLWRHQAALLPLFIALPAAASVTAQRLELVSDAFPVAAATFLLMLGTSWVMMRGAVLKIRGTGRDARAAGVLALFEKAAGEIRRGVKRRQPGTIELLAAVKQIRPDFYARAELVADLGRGLDRFDGPLFNEYFDELFKRRRELSEEVIEILADVTAAATIVFAGRKDLLAAMPAVQKVTVDLSAFTIDDASTARLAESRRLLRQAANGIAA